MSAQQKQIFKYLMFLLTVVTMIFGVNKFSKHYSYLHIRTHRLFCTIGINNQNLRSGQERWNVL